MGKDIGIGVGAGLVAALLFGLLLKASALAILLYLLAPLPILIVGLGWSHRAGLAAVASGAVALALIVSPYLGLAFAAYLAIPAWWLAYLAMLGRPGRDGTLEWYPTGRLLAWVAGTAALAFVAIAVIASPDYDTFRTQIGQMSRRVVQVQVQRGRLPPPAQGNAAEGDAAKSDAPKTEAPDAAPPAADDLAGEVADALATLAPALAAQGLAVLLPSTSGPPPASSRSPGACPAPGRTSPRPRCRGACFSSSSAPWRCRWRRASSACSASP